LPFPQLPQPTTSTTVMARGRNSSSGGNKFGSKGVDSVSTAANFIQIFLLRVVQSFSCVRTQRQYWLRKSLLPSCSKKRLTQTVRKIALSGFLATSVLLTNLSVTGISQSSIAHATPASQTISAFNKGASPVASVGGCDTFSIPGVREYVEEYMWGDNDEYDPYEAFYEAESSRMVETRPTPTLQINDEGSMGASPFAGADESMSSSEKLKKKAFLFLIENVRTNQGRVKIAALFVGVFWGGFALINPFVDAGWSALSSSWKKEDENIYGDEYADPTGLNMRKKRGYNDDKDGGDDGDDGDDDDDDDDDDDNDDDDDDDDNDSN